MRLFSKLLRNRNCRRQKKKEQEKKRAATVAALKLYQAPAREVLRRLEENDPTVVGWRITPDFGMARANDSAVHLDDLLLAMRANFTLKRLEISGKFVARLSLMEQYQFWHVLSSAEECFPNLTSICWTDFTSLPISVVTSLLKGRQQRERGLSYGLIEVEWSHVRLTGDLEVLRQVLKEHTSLRTIQTWDIGHRGEGAGNNNNMPQASSSQNRLLQILLNVQQLHVLSLGSFDFSYGQISAIANALTCHKLKALRLRGACSTDQQPDENNLHHHQRPQATTQTLDVQSCAALANMLKVNTSLEKLELSNLQLLNTENNSDNNNEQQSGLVLMAQALQHHNRTLESFHLFQFDLYCRHDMTNDENDALVAMLHDNHLLTSFLPHGCSRQAQAQIEFYLKCNQRQLWGLHVDVNLSRAELVDDVLAPLAMENRGDLDCIYHVLRDNPSSMAVTAAAL